MIITALDLEFTGLDKNFDRIIEIGAIKFNCEPDSDRLSDFNIYSTLINVSVPVPDRITELTGITEAMLKGGPDEKTAITGLMEFIGDSDILLGHNIPCDFSFLKVALNRYNIEKNFFGIDTLKLSRICHPELEKKTLEAMCSYYEIIPDKKHRATEDAKSAAILFFCLKNAFCSKYPEAFVPFPLIYKEKKVEPAMKKQIKLLKELVEANNITTQFDYDNMTKSEASHYIDKIKSHLIS